jgi:predicted branched-subunit amino acid permease
MDKNVKVIKGKYYYIWHYFWLAYIIGSLLGFLLGSLNRWGLMIFNIVVIFILLYFGFRMEQKA